MQRARTDMDRDEQDRGDQVASVGAQRVRDHRAHAILRPLTDEASRDLTRHARQGRTNQVAVTVRFPRTLPHAFREEVLRKTWGLARDEAHRCWHGTAESEAATDEMRRVVALHGGMMEAGSWCPASTLHTQRHATEHATTDR
jgi:hypothetical protein